MTISPAQAMDPSRAMSQYIHEHWGPEQGLPRGPVYAITQTPDGYLWIGMQAGLVRFDGFNFVVVSDPSRNFQIANVLGLAPASDDPNGTVGGLWVWLQGSTLLRYRNGVFERAPNTRSEASITAMSETAQGELLIAKNEVGVLGARDGEFKAIGTGAAMPRSPVLSLAQTPAGDLWLGTRDAGLLRASVSGLSASRVELPDTKINCLLPDGKQGLWIGTDNGVVRWNGNEIVTAGLPAGVPTKLKGFQALAMLQDRDGNLWVGTDSQGLLRVSGQGVSSLNQTGARPEAVTAVFEDREGNLWTGSASGLDRLRDSPFVSYSAPEGLPTDGSNPVYVDEENRTWFPPVAGGLWWVKNGQHGVIHQAGLDNDVVYSIDGREGELWLGRQRGGLTRLAWPSGASESFTTRTYTHADGLAQDSVYSVYDAPDGTVWAGTLSGGVSRLKDGNFTTYTIQQGLASNTVAAILETSDGTAWFATPNGLSALTKDRWISYAPRDGLPSENINCLFEDSGGVLWVGTSAGLAFRARQQFQGISAVPEQLRDQILGIAEGRYGGMWIATSRRVLRIDRKKLMRGFLAPEDIREFTLADGLRGSEGVKRERSVVSDRLGRIWFSLNRGISVVDPARFNRSEIPVITQIQSVFADNTPISLGPSLQIPAGRQRLTFDFAGLNLSIPERVRYRFKLDGFDRGWNGPSSAGRQFIPISVRADIASMSWPAIWRVYGTVKKQHWTWTLRPNSGRPGGFAAASRWAWPSSSWAFIGCGCGK